MPVDMTPERQKDRRFYWIVGLFCVASTVCFVILAVGIQNDFVKYVDAGHSLFARGDYKGAEADYSAYLERHPRQCSVRVDLAKTYLQEGMKAEARHQLEMAVYEGTGHAPNGDIAQWQAEIDNIDKSN